MHVCFCWLQDIIFSFPVKCRGGKWEIVQGLKLDEFSKDKLKATGELPSPELRSDTLPATCPQNDISMCG